MSTNAPARARQHTVYRLADGTRVPGVTTVLNCLEKPGLVPWSNKLGLDGIKVSEYKDELAQIGTLAHHLIICDLTGQTPDVREYTPAQQDQAAQSIASWLAWRKVHTIEPILTEAPLVSEVYRYGGTLDLFAYIDGEPTLADLKTAKAIYSEMRTQVVAYSRLIAEHAMRLNLPLCGAIKIIRVGREPGEGFEECPVDHSGARWELFLHCLAIYGLLKAVK
ncbi:MAG: hypothetical protein ACYDCO_25540 [Armatimonadota bacterium]